MSEYKLFYPTYTSSTDRQLLLLNVAGLWSNKLVILAPVGAGWDTFGADHIARDTMRQFKARRSFGECNTRLTEVPSVGILQPVPPILSVVSELNPNEINLWSFEIKQTTTSKIKRNF